MNESSYSPNQFDGADTTVSLQEETHFRVLSLLQANPHLSQRELAAALGVSLGKANYLVKALLAKGQLKLAAFRRGGRQA